MKAESRQKKPFVPLLPNSRALERLSKLLGRKSRRVELNAAGKAWLEWGRHAET